jgi:hypothetical protein
MRRKQVKMLDPAVFECAKTDKLMIVFNTPDLTFREYSVAIEPFVAVK